MIKNNKILTFGRLSADGVLDNSLLENVFANALTDGSDDKTSSSMTGFSVKPFTGT